MARLSCWRVRAFSILRPPVGAGLELRIAKQKMMSTRLLASMLVCLVFWPVSSSAEPLQLEEAVRLARARALKIVLARADLSLAQTEHALALAPVLPRVDLRVSAEELFGTSQIIEARGPFRQQLGAGEPPQYRYGPFEDGLANSYSNPRFTLTLTARQRIFDGGRWWIVLARADDLEAQRRAALDEVLDEVRLEAVVRYFQLERERRALRALSGQLEVGQELLRLAETRRAEGAGLANDVAAAQRNLIADEISRDRRILSEYDALAALNVLIGREASAPLELQSSSALAAFDPEELAAQIPPLEGLLATADASHPALVRLRAAIEESDKNVRAARADYWPEVSLGLTYARESRRPDRVFADPTGNFFALLDLTASWNIFSGRQTSIQVERAEIDLDRARSTLDDAKRRVEAQVTAAHDRLRRLLEIYHRARRAPIAAEEAVRLARTLYQEGRGRALEVRDAELQRTQALLAEIDTRLEIEIAVEVLRHAVGEDIDGLTRLHDVDPEVDPR